MLPTAPPHATIFEKHGGMRMQNDNPTAYCEACDSSNGFEEVSIYACNLCQYEFETWSDYCPSCDWESRIEFCEFMCKQCGSYIPEVVC